MTQQHDITQRVLTTEKRNEFIRRTSYISEADRDTRAAFVDEIVRAALASAPVADDLMMQDETLADRLDRMAFAQPTGSQSQSDLLAAATIWRKHVSRPASAPVADAPLTHRCANCGAVFQGAGCPSCRLAAPVASAPVTEDDEVERIRGRGPAYPYTPNTAPPTPLASAPVAGEAQERIEQMAVNRYRPVPDGKFSYKVVAGDGSRSLYTGTKDSCLRVAAKLTEAFLDGAFVASDASPQSSKDGEHGE
ncbi:hypothetical protein ACOTJ6_13000 [Achromobacter xylosoxidans]